MISKARKAWIWSWGEPYQIESVPHRIRSSPRWTSSLPSRCAASSGLPITARQVEPSSAYTFAPGPRPACCERGDQAVGAAVGRRGVEGSLGRPRTRSPSGTRRAIVAGGERRPARCRPARRRGCRREALVHAHDRAAQLGRLGQEGVADRPGRGRPGTSRAPACGCRPSRPRSGGRRRAPPSRRGWPPRYPRLGLAWPCMQHPLVVAEVAGPGAACAPSRRSTAGCQGRRRGWPTARHRGVAAEEDLLQEPLGGVAVAGRRPRRTGPGGSRCRSVAGGARVALEQVALDVEHQLLAGQHRGRRRRLGGRLRREREAATRRRSRSVGVGGALLVAAGVERGQRRPRRR